MNLRQTILKEHSKVICTKVVNWVGNSQQRFDELFRIFLNDENVITQRAAWPMSNAVMEHPELIRKHLGALLKNLKKPNLHTSIKRNSIRLLENLAIPERYQGVIMNLCFDYITAPGEKAAVKASSLSVLENLSRQYPEILSELKTIIRDRWDFEGAAFRSRAKKILNQP